VSSERWLLHLHAPPSRLQHLTARRPASTTPTRMHTSLASRWLPVLPMFCFICRCDCPIIAHYCFFLLHKPPHSTMFEHSKEIPFCLIHHPVVLCWLVYDVNMAKLNKCVIHICMKIMKELGGASATVLGFPTSGVQHVSHVDCTTISWLPFTSDHQLLLVFGCY
jgi:hypothetical protein